MPELMNIDKLFDGVRTAENFARLDAKITDAALHSIRAEFDANSDPFDQHRAICAQIATTDSPELRQVLTQLRERFNAEMLSAAISEISQAFDRSPDDGWKVWLTKLAASVSAFHHCHSMRLCEQVFPFDPSRHQSVADLRQAAQYMLQSRWDEAYEQLDFLSQQEHLPISSQARLSTIVGQIDLWWFDNRARARVRLEEAEQVAPNDCLAIATLGDYWLAEKDVNRAIDYYQRAIEKAPKMAYGYTGMGDRFEKEENLEQAEEWYQKAISIAGGDSSGYGRLLRLLGRPANLSNREKEFLEVARMRILVDPETEYDTYLDVGWCYLGSNRFSDAREWYKKAIELEKDWPRAYTALAEICRTEGNDEEAETLCKKAIEISPDCPEGYNTLAKIYEDKSQWSDAVGIYKAFPQRPQYWASYAQASIGRMHYKLEQYAEAERVLFEELRANAEEPHAQYALETIAEDCYQKRNDSESATRIYDELRHVLGEKYEGSYRNWLGNMQYFHKDYSSAVAEYRRAVESLPKEVVYHDNLGAAYQLLRDYESAGREIETVYLIDKDEKVYRQKKASLANEQGIDAYEKANYREAVEHYTKAIELDSMQAVYYTNLAWAWEAWKDPENRLHAIDQAIHCYERAQEITQGQSYKEQIDRLRRRKNMVQVYGEKVLDYVNVVTPITVEVAADLIPYIEGPTLETLSDELMANVEVVRDRIMEDFGIKIPGIRFRDNEFDLPSSTYTIIINEVPLESGNFLADKRFCPGSKDVLSKFDVNVDDQGFDPVSRQNGVWVNREDWEKVESQKLELWGITQYLMRHVEAVLRKNLKEFLGHQEMMIRLGEEVGQPFETIRASSQMVTDLNAVCKALVAEEVSIHPFQELCAAFTSQYSNNVSLRAVVEQIRSLPAFRELLPGNDGRHSFVTLSARFEAELRGSIYDQGGHLILTMEPARCQEALTALRQNRLPGQSQAIVVSDATLRPFIRRLVELEPLSPPVLSRSELRTDIKFIEAGSADLEGEFAAGSRDFRSPHRSDAAGNPEKISQVLALSEMEVVVFTGKDFETDPSSLDLDDQPIQELFSMMQDGLFYELGLVLPQVSLKTDPNLTPGEFKFRLNGIEYGPVSGLKPDEFLVNDTVDRLALLEVEGREANNPANGIQCAIVQETKGQAETCKQAGLTTWGPRGYLILSLSSEIRKAAARFQTDEVTQYCLDSLGEAFPDLVTTALERFPLPRISQLLRELLYEEISIRDLRGILESLLSIDGTTDVDMNRFIVFIAHTDGLCPATTVRSASDLTAAQFADFVRASLKSYISYKYTRGEYTLVVYLIDPAIESRIADVGVHPFTDEEEDKLRTAVREEIQHLPPSTVSPVLLTTFEIRRPLRKLIEREFPQLAVLSYQELSLDLNIQPIGRISWASLTHAGGDQDDTQLAHKTG